MPAVIVDPARCQKDGLCVAACPLEILELGANATPRTREGYASRCVACGHCMAVCPKDALLLEGTRQEDLLPVKTSAMAGPEPLSQLMRARRSIRLYKDELVDPSVIESILDVARWAPTGKNEQPLRYTVVSGREQLKTLSAFCIDYFSLLLEQAPERALALGARGLVKTWKAGKDPILREAPQLIVAHGLQQNPMLVGSAFIALTQIDLQLVAYGLGGCWAGYLQIAASAHAPLREALKLPAGDTVAGALMFGVPRIKFRSIPPRKPLQVTWL